MSQHLHPHLQNPMKVESSMMKGTLGNLQKGADDTCSQGLRHKNLVLLCRRTQQRPRWLTAGNEARHLGRRRSFQMAGKQYGARKTKLTTLRTFSRTTRSGNCQYPMLLALNSLKQRSRQSRSSLWRM